MSDLASFLLFPQMVEFLAGMAAILIGGISAIWIATRNL